MPGPLAESASVAAATSRAKMVEQNYRTEMAALKYRRAAGELVPLADVRLELQRIFSAVVACLRAVPPRLGGAADGRDASEIERLAAKMIDDAFAEFQNVNLPGAEP